MALVYQNLTLEVTPGMLPPILHVTEYDINMQIDVTFVQRGQPYEIPSDTTAKVEGTLAGHPFRESCTVNGNTVTFILTKNMTAYAGRAWTKIVLAKDSWPVSTCGFWLDCDRAGVEAETVIGAPGFEEQIQQGVADYMSQHTVRAEDERVDALATFTEETGRVPLFTNQLPISTDTDGTIFHGVGYHEGYRFDSSGEEVAATGVSTTGFIPCVRTAVLRFQNITFYASATGVPSGRSANYCYILYYDSEKTFIGQRQLREVYDIVPAALTVVDNIITAFDLSATLGTPSRAAPEGTAYVRFSGYDVSASSIITVNEEIAYDEHGEITSAALKPDVSIPQLAPLDVRISALEEDEGGGSAEDDRVDALATFTEETGRVPLFTNQLPISTDTDGTIFHGVGYHEGYRFNSSGEEVAATGVSTTGFIPCVRTAVLRFQNITFYASATGVPSGRSANYCYILYYDSEKAFIGQRQLREIYDIVPAALTVSDNLITALDLSATLGTPSRAAPEGTAYVRFSGYDVSASSIITVNEEIAYDEHGKITSAALKPDVSIPQLAPLNARITALEEDEGGGTIDSTDPLVKYAKQIDNGLTVGYEPTLTGRPTANLVAKKYLNFLHISDTHGSVNAENAVKILNKLKADGRCSFLIHTGDFHSSTFAGVASWNTFAGYIAQATAPVLLVSGNHDVGNNSQSTTDGTTATDAQLYARCFAPYVSGWNLTSHPTGKCYWYKDFADEGVRLIGLYDFESDYATDSNGQLLYKRGYAAYHQAQIDWLVQALLSCPSGYGVIIAKHNPMNKRGTLDNPFNGEFLQGQNTSQSYVSKDMIAEIVQAFMDGTTINKTFAQTGNVTDTLTVNQSFANKNTGAHFVCYLDGHTHADGVNFLADFPKQLELNIGCDNYHYQHYADTYNQQGTLHQDLLNYVSVDVNRGYVYIQRIGNDYTAQADRRDFTAIDYKNPPVVVDFPEVDASDDGKVWGVSGGQYGLIASPTPTEPVLEEILTYTYDGTENAQLVFDKDSNGNAFRLKKMAVIATLSTVVSAGTFSGNYRCGNTLLGEIYSSYATSHNNSKCTLTAEQQNGYWMNWQTIFGGSLQNAYVNKDYLFNRPVSSYPYIDSINIGTVSRILPAGSTIKILGIRA